MRITTSRGSTWGIKGGQSFYFMEQVFNVMNQLPYNALKWPGDVGLLIWQVVVHRGDSALFFQVRRSVGACGKYHRALMDHTGYEYTRVFREVQALGAQLAALSDAALGARTAAKAAIVVDWDNWRTLEYSAGPSHELKYLGEAERYYQPFLELSTPVDTVSVEDDLEEYKVVVAKDQITPGVTRVIQNMYSP